MLESTGYQASYCSLKALLQLHQNGSLGLGRWKHDWRGSPVGRLTHFLSSGFLLFVSGFILLKLKWPRLCTCLQCSRVQHCSEGGRTSVFELSAFPLHDCFDIVEITLQDLYLNILANVSKDMAATSALSFSCYRHGNPSWKICDWNERRRQKASNNVTQRTAKAVVWWHVHSLLSHDICEPCWL